MTTQTASLAARKQALTGRRARVTRFADPLSLWLLLICVLFFVGPVVMMGFNAFQHGVPGAQSGWTWEGMAHGLFNPEMAGVLVATLGYSVAVSLISTLVGVYFAWLFTRTDAPGRRIIPVVMISIIATPALFYAIAYDSLANASTGTLNVFVRGMFGIEGNGPLDIQSWTGLIFVASIKSAAFTFILIVPAFVRMSRSLEEAAKLSGSGSARVLFGITVPVVMPSIFAAAILAFIHAVESFELPLILGSPAEITILSTQVYAFLNEVTGANYAAASAIALPVVAVILLLVYLQHRALGQRDFVTVSGKIGGTSRESLGGSRWLHTAAVLVFLVVGLLLPVLQILQSSTAQNRGSWTEFTLRHFESMFSSRPIMDALLNTWLLAIIGGFVIAVFCVLMSWIVRRSNTRAARLAGRSVWLGTALPGILLGVAIFSLIMVVPGARALYGSIWLLFIGLFIAAVPIAIRGAEGSVKQIGIELYEASRVNGAGRARGWLGTIAPLLKPGVGAAWFIAAVIIASNVAVPLLLSTPRTSVLAVEALVRYREGFVQLASAMILVNLLVWVLAYLAIVLANVIGASITERRNRARAKEHIEMLEPKREKDEVWS